jgi:uncharacterized cofD-like protein
MRVKRWLVLLLAGVTLLALGLAAALIDVYQGIHAPAALQPALSVATLQWLPSWLRALVLGLAGLGLLVVGLVGLNRSLLSAVSPGGTGDLLAVVDRRRRGQSGPKIVAVGGGTGLSTLLRGLKAHTSNLTAIVTVADDGGSSGRLRRSLNVPPPGDFRQCIAALADTEPLMQRLFEYRFGDGGELGGHAFGNLFIVAMTGITGSFVGALQAASRVLKVAGRIVPSTLEHVTLFAELEDARVMAGESEVPKGASPIRRVFLEPAQPPAYPEAVKAILDADLVVLGPGSLYTSLLPNLLVPEIAAALAATQAPVLYVANVATQPGETDGYGLTEHLAALRRHAPEVAVDLVLANDNLSRTPFPPAWQAAPVGPTLVANGHGPPPRLVSADVVSEAQPTRHDPAKLAAAIVRLWRDERRRRRPAAL